MLYWCYILQCADNTLYTGWTDCPSRRLAAHNRGNGAKYTRARLPVDYVYLFPFTTQSDAMREEWRIKQLSRKEKLQLIHEKGVCKTMVVFIGYPPCSTCKKAEKWLSEHHIPYQYRHIVENTPTPKELEQWTDVSGKNIRKFFNTSGVRYRDLGLAVRIKSMPLDEQIKLLSSDGMLIKRPLLITSEKVLVGFNAAQWEDALSKNESSD